MNAINLAPQHASVITTDPIAPYVELKAGEDEEFVFHGPTEPPLQELTTARLLQQRHDRHPEKVAVKIEEAIVRDAQGRPGLRTGDIVTLSASGACRVVGRVKDMIKKGGENIAPGDVEKVLEQHPDIVAAAVVGIPNVRLGEAITAYIQRAPGVQGGLKSMDVKIWLRSRIATHKIPDHVFWIGEDAGIPHQSPVNASGKVLKTELSAIASGLVRGDLC
ncbi:hypothetical protein BDV24DRAFT_167382 [Aspergillus arachidicola]|uniref:AMP-binding enzyme C-terminal domain-containing protein n=1 Tax=Aspergillus arachidicola TaxID=656916 RepID=A0A5N6XW53_9EURO|nr:hypothetical protein BDV24DRAFT_167382 [Aspergillus arachidicola]